MSPYDEGEECDDEHGSDHGFVTEDRFARLRCDNFRRQSERRQQYDVYFRVTEEPEQVLEQNRASAGIMQRCAADINIGEVKTRSETSVEQQQQSSSKQNRERKNTED